MAAIRRLGTEGARCCPWPASAVSTMTAPVRCVSGTTYGDTHHRGRTSAELALAEVHVWAGEPRGLVLARQAIHAVSSLQSVAARQERFVPLATALETRPGSEAKELAGVAHQVAATQV